MPISNGVAAAGAAGVEDETNKPIASSGVDGGRAGSIIGSSIGAATGAAFTSTRVIAAKGAAGKERGRVVFHGACCKDVARQRSPPSACECKPRAGSGRPSEDLESDHLSALPRLRF